MLERKPKHSWVEIDYDAIAHNLDEIQKLVGKTKIMGIVKADAYGHGAIQCTRAMEKWGVDFFAVATLEEALELREAGIQSDILILGYTDPKDTDLLVENDLIQTIVDLPYAKELEKWGSEHNALVRTHIKADTGMNRIGISWQHPVKDLAPFIEVYQLPHVKAEGIFSHYPVSDSLHQSDMAFTRNQTELFCELVEQLTEAGINPGLKHIQNSYGILNYGDLGMDYCRPGLLYMGVTSDDAIPVLSDPDFIPILTWKAQVAMVKDVHPGQTVSYGRHFMACEPRKVATITVGYADGYPRACSNTDLEVIINGQKAPVIGNICMDQCMVDVTGLDVKAGDEVILAGKDKDLCVSIDQISRHAHTINNETLTRITARVSRKPACHDKD